jgi:hypothetical protein
VEATTVLALAELGASLTVLAAKGTATAVTNKIKTIKDERSTDKIRSTYDEIINELLNERDEAIRIAQSYKSEVDRIAISDDDIEHLSATVDTVLGLLKTYSPELSVSQFEVFKVLINKDTLKTMQLLGFNYKAAIGEPLTNICAEKIKSLSKKNSQNKGQPKK